MITFKNVVKKFGNKIVLNNISFQIKKGEILFILGTSGTGKSVLLKNIVGLMSPDEGEIWVDDVNVTKLTEEQYFPIRKKCGMVFQHPALLDSFTVFENIAFGVRKHFNYSEEEIEKIVKHMLASVNLSGIEQKYPNEISYGMQKRVSMARTLAVEPEILLFDEPTTGLDPITTNSINLLIQKLSREFKTTSIIVSHDMHCALGIADRIIVLDQGRIAAQDTVDKIKKSEVPIVRDFLSEALNG